LWGPLAGATTAVDVTIIPTHKFPLLDINEAKETGDPYFTMFSVKHGQHCWKFSGVIF